MTKLESTINQFEKALMRFQEVLTLPKTDIVRDAAIKRFEFTLDLSWKMLKAFLEDKRGIVCASPKDGEEIIVKNENDKNQEGVAVIVPYKKYIKKQERPFGILKGKASYKIKDGFRIADEELLTL